MKVESFSNCVVKRFGLGCIGYKEKAYQFYGFGVWSKYIINQTSTTGRECKWYFSNIIQKIYAIQKSHSIIIENILDEDAEEVWIVQNEIYGILYCIKSFCFITHSIFICLNIQKREKEIIMIQIREEVGEHITEEVFYGNYYIGWKKKDKWKRLKEEKK
jgi:hypothetical protein